MNGYKPTKVEENHNPLNVEEMIENFQITGPCVTLGGTEINETDLTSKVIRNAFSMKDTWKK